MARVNHKRVKQLLNEKRSKITDRQFFTSRILAGHFEDVAAAQTRRYKYNRRVHVQLYWKPKESSIAYTNNTTIYINCGNRLVTKVKGRNERYDIVSGLFAHELGHVLYTDFLLAQSYNNFLSAYKWFPEPPILRNSQDFKNEKAFWEYVKAEPRNLEMAQYMVHYIANVLEDGYIENRILTQFPGVIGYSLETMRERQFEQIPTVEEMVSEEDDGERHIFDTILQIMLSYAKFGKIKYGSIPLSDERIQTVFQMISDIDEAIMNRSARERWKIVSFITVRCWNYIEDYIELCKKKQDDSVASGGSSTVADTLSEMLKSLMGTSESSDGTSEAVTEIELEVPSSASEVSRSKTKELANESESGETETIADGKESEEITSGKQETTSAEGGRIPYHQTDEISEPVGGNTEYDSDYKSELNKKAASDIERMLDQMAEKAARKQVENERTQELNEVAQSISYGDVHSGINVKVNRIAEVDDCLKEAYDYISGPLLAISKQLQKSLIQKLREQQRGGKQTGLVMGRRLDAHALCRNDGKVFYKNQLPNEIPRLSVGLLLDESGSMSCSDRSSYARAAAIILYDFCTSLGIPITVYGHTTSGNDSVELFSYAEFESIDQDDKYRLMDIDARRSNRDGAALRFMAEQLAKRTEDVRILMIISDGQPAACGYSGSAAEEDLRGIKQEYRRKGILFIAAAIGDDKQNIERIYGDSFMDITDLNQLPIKLTAVIKRFLKV